MPPQSQSCSAVPVGMFFLCAHPTITIREHLLDRFTEARKTFQGKIIISIGCLHSFQGLLYIVLTFVVTEATRDLCWDIRAQRHKLFFSSSSSSSFICLFIVNILQKDKIELMEARSRGRDKNPA